MILGRGGGESEGLRVCGVRLFRNYNLYRG